MKVIAMLCLLFLAACSNKPPEPRSAPKATSASTAAPWDTLKQDEQRAKDVQKLLDKHSAEQDQQIQQASQ